MQDESLLEIFVITGILILGSFALAAFILWLKDRSGFIGRSVQAMLGMVVLSIGLAILAIAGYLIATSQLGVSSIPRIVFGVGLPISMIVVGWYWVRGEYKGIQDFRIDPNSPELQDSVLQARAQLPRFVAHVEQHADPAYVRFALVTRAGPVEHVWAHVRKVQHGKLEVTVLPNPGMTRCDYEIERVVMESEVEDWQILYSDGCISGAFSTIASYRYLENRGVRLSRTMRKQKAKLLDA